MRRLVRYAAAFLLCSSAGFVARAEEPPAPPAAEAAGPVPPPGEATEASIPPLAAYIPDEGFRIRSKDGNWKLRVGLNAGIKYEPTFEPSPVGNNWANFPLAFVRPYFEGNLFRPWIEYFFQLELGVFPPTLLDGFIDVVPWKFFGARLGLQYTPLSRHESHGPGGLLFPEWTLVANYFWTGYERGLTLHGSTHILQYYAGFYDGTSTRVLTSVPGNFVILGRLSINPLGPMGNEMPYVTATDRVPFRFGFTLQGDYGRTSITESNLNPSSGLVVATATGVEEGTALASADFTFQVSRISFITEFYYRHIEPRGAVTGSFNQLGAWAQLGYVIYRRWLSAGLRFNWIDPNLDLSNDNVYTGEAMLAWWVAGPRLSLKLRYEVGHQQNPGPAPPADPNFFNFVVLPLELGTSHLITLQVTITL